MALKYENLEVQKDELIEKKEEVKQEIKDLEQEPRSKFDKRIDELLNMLNKLDGKIKSIETLLNSESPVEYNPIDELNK